MRKWIIVAALAAFSVGAQAAGPGCAEQAAAKKLAGAAKASFMKKCEGGGASANASPMARCEKMAAEKKLHGAAKASFVKKCAKG